MNEIDLQRLDKVTIGHLMYDPDASEDLDEVSKALMSTGKAYVISLVEGFTQPRLSTKTGRYLGADAIKGFANAYNNGQVAVYEKLHSRSDWPIPSAKDF